MAKKQNSIYATFEIILDKFRTLIDPNTDHSEMSKHLFLKLTRVQNMRAFKTYTEDSQQTLMSESPIVLQMFGFNRLASMGMEAFIPVMAPLKESKEWYAYRIDSLPENLLQNSFEIYTDHLVSRLFPSMDISFLNSCPPVRDVRETKKIQSIGFDLGLFAQGVTLLKSKLVGNGTVYITEADKLIRLTRSKSNGCELSVYIASQLYQCY